MRSFIALNLPDTDRRALYDAAQPLRDAVAGAAWVAAGNLHLTLKFLGEVEEERAAELARRLRDIGAAHRPLTLDLGGAGVFPNLRAPRIVWMGVAPDSRLELLFHDVERASEDLGFAVEGRAFRPHITLGRLRPPPGADDRRALTMALRGLAFSRRVRVETLDLMGSTLGAGGSRYSVLTAAPLGEGEER